MNLNKLNTFFQIAFCALLLTLASCKKDGVEKKETGTKVLTSKTWFYYEYFTNYSESSSILVYKLEKSYNLLDLSSNRIKFNDDNTFEETAKDTSPKKGVWKSVANDQIEVRDSRGVLVFTIVTLNEGFLVWSNKEKDTYGTLLAQ